MKNQKSQLRKQTDIFIDDNMRDQIMENHITLKFLKTNSSIFFIENSLENWSTTEIRYIILGIKLLWYLNYLLFTLFFDYFKEVHHFSKFCLFSIEVFHAVKIVKKKLHEKREWKRKQRWFLLLRIIMKRLRDFQPCLSYLSCLFLNRIIWAKRVVSRFTCGIPRGQAMLPVWGNPAFPGVHGKGSYRPNGLRLSPGSAGHVHAGQISLLRGLSAVEGTASFHDYNQKSI